MKLGIALRSVLKDAVAAAAVGADLVQSGASRGRPSAVTPSFHPSAARLEPTRFSSKFGSTAPSRRHSTYAASDAKTAQASIRQRLYLASAAAIRFPAPRGAAADDMLRERIPRHAADSPPDRLHISLSVHSELEMLLRCYSDIPIYSGVVG